MQLDDLPAVLAIEREVFPSPWTARLFREALQNPATFAWVGKDGETIAGYCLFTIAADECDLLNIAVAPEARRCGIGARFMAAMRDYARRRKCTAIYLDVRASNAAAKALYRRFGFRPVGRRRRYYRPDGEDAVVMACPLA